ncbi:MAG: hypothetical protein IT439_03450 [Phycisphaerales bacterium]|nr:hypothetical protein [Phycisphaerales bacterium]
MAFNTERGVSVEPAFLTRVYQADDPNAADILLTDLPRERLRPGAPLDGVNGHLVRITLFMRPVPGKTPIDSTAINAAITHVVVADGRVGVYAGGGFFRVDGPLDAAAVEGHFGGGMVRLAGSTAGFVDLLGAGEVKGSVSARRDAPLASLLRARLDELVKLAEASEAEPNR